jgi:hypothetical protein
VHEPYTDGFNKVLTAKFSAPIDGKTFHPDGKKINVV